MSIYPSIPSRDPKCSVSFFIASTRAWTVGYYLDNAKLRITAAYVHAPVSAPDDILPHTPATVAILTRREWDRTHGHLRILINTLPIKTKLLVDVEQL